MDATVEVALITTLGLVVVAAIGVITAKMTSGARRESAENAQEASKSAQVARDFATALGAKDALIGAINDRVVFLEARDKECNDRLTVVEAELRTREEEDVEQKRAASILERTRVEEITSLRQEISDLKTSR